MFIPLILYVMFGGLISKKQELRESLIYPEKQQFKYLPFKKIIGLEKENL